MTLLNIRPEHHTDSGTFDYVSADARQLPFGDGAFDVIFSNSVIEHVGTHGEQRRFAEEVRRVGRLYWVQTPNRWYPIEARLFTPLARRWTLWDWIEQPSTDRRERYIRHHLSTVQLLAAAELKALFPGGRLLRERHLGLTKSLIVAKTT